MAVLATGNTFATGDNPTAATLNAAVNSASFVTGAVDNTTTQLSAGAIIVKDGGVTPAKLSTGHPDWTSGGVLSASGGLDNTSVGATTPAAGSFTTLAANSTSSIYEVVEKASVSATALTGTVQYNWLDGAVVLLTANAAGNWTLNVRGNSGTTLNSSLATGDCITFAIIVPQGSTAYYPSAHTIDGSSVTPVWSGGTAPTAGNANGRDVYTYTIIKTASATFTVLASQTKFA